MDLELLNALINGGGTAILVYLVIDMRREAARDRAQLWELISYLVKRSTPDMEVPPLPSMVKRNGGNDAK